MAPVPPPRGESSSRTLAPFNTRTRRRTSKGVATDRSFPQPDAPWPEGGGGRESPPALFTTTFRGAVSRHATPSTAKLKVEEALRPAGVRRSSTTLPNPGTRVLLTRGPPHSRQVISKLGSAPSASIRQTRETTP